MAEAIYTAETARERLQAALSAAGAAVTGMAEALRSPIGLEEVVRDGLAWSEADPFMPLEDEVIEPLIDALRLSIHAIGLPKPTHRISLALDAFTQGVD